MGWRDRAQGATGGPCHWQRVSHAVARRLRLYYICIDNRGQPGALGQPLEVDDIHSAAAVVGFSVCGLHAAGCITRRRALAQCTRPRAPRFLMIIAQCCMVFNYKCFSAPARWGRG